MSWQSESEAMKWRDQILATASCLGTTKIHPNQQKSHPELYFLTGQTTMQNKLYLETTICNSYYYSSWLFINNHTLNIIPFIKCYIDIYL